MLFTICPRLVQAGLIADPPLLTLSCLCEDGSRGMNAQTFLVLALDGSPHFELACHAAFQPILKKMKLQRGSFGSIEDATVQYSFLHF